MLAYLPPESNPRCLCFPSLLAMFFCPYGHLLGCHYPLTCVEAECSHWEAAMAEEVTETMLEERPPEVRPE